jgi:hypothetical protein
MDQLDRQLRAAILGNTLTQVFFRISNQDATALAAEIGQREKPIIQRRLVNLNQREAYIKKKGEQARVMKSKYVPPPRGTRKNASALKELSMSYHARPRKEVEQEIANRIHPISRRGETPKRYSPKSDPHNGQYAPTEAYEEDYEW